MRSEEVEYLPGADSQYYVIVVLDAIGSSPRVGSTAEIPECQRSTARTWAPNSRRKNTDAGRL